MKKNGYLRRFLALFLALVMIMADSSVTTFAATVGRVRQQNATQKVTPTPGNSNTYRDVLGGAVNYGIVTTRLILGGHIDTNFAAGSLEPDTFADAITTGKYTGENNPGNIIIGDIPNHKDGFWAYSSTKKPFIITTTAEALQYIKKERDYVIYDVDHTKEELQQRVEKLRTGTMSAALADESRYTYYTLSSLLNGDQLDLRSYADGTYYIKVDNSAIISQAEGLKIQLNDKQNIVFYVPDNDVAINKFKINEMFSDRNDLSADPYAKRIIWNIPNATHVKIDNTFGVFLCPNADVDLGGTSSGWVVSKSFHNGGEWHNVWSEQPESIITKTNFCVEKKLAGANIANYAGKFNFVLMDEAGKKIQTKSNDGNGNVVFDDIQFDTAGTYTYYITEKNEQLANIGYDTGKVKVTVVVKTYTNQGNRKVTTIESVVYEKLDKDNNKIEESNVFKNSYNEAASGSLSLEGSKLLTGAALTDGMFEFQLSGDAEKTVKNAGTKVDFGTIASWTGTDAKEFTFEVSEVNDGKAGYTYDGKTYKVKVKATYSAETNTYSYSIMNGTTEGVTISKIGVISLPNASFVNEYNATGETTLTATKTLSGREFQAGDNWKFTVTCNDANAPLPENPVVTTTATSGTSTTLDFGKIHYTIADVNKDYVYTITESGNVANVTNDPVAARTVTVSVRDKGDGTLNVTQEVTGAGLIFTNKYVDGETTLSVTKVLSGREFKSGDEWTFKLTADEGAPMPAQTVVKTDATSGNSQSLSFGTIKYTLADVGNTYTYTIQETGSAEGVTNDPNATRTVTITVNEGKDGKLDIVREEPKGEIVFTNTYDAKGSLTLEASKTLKNKALEADAFNFVLKDENGETIQTVANDANGNVTFRPLNYTLEDVGLHTYTVSEVQKADAEVTYDTTVYTVEVTVADTGDGTLNVSKTIKKGSDTPGTMTFENIYKGVIEISGTKNWADENNQDGIRPTSITVNLFANGTKVADQKVTPDANGNWSYVFRNLPQYDVNGEITYTVTEDAVAGYETSVSGYNITNTHKPATTDITGTKTWNDSDNQDGKRPESITVNLLADGKITATKTVTAADNWTYSFTDLPKYANGEEITYTVSEDTVADYTTTYDGSNITNSYTPGKTSATVTKIWNDAENQDGKRPESITVSLLADGKETGKTVTLSVENNWKQTIFDLPEKADGKAIEGANGENYTLTEAEIGKVITVAVTSSIETGSLVSAPTDAVIKEELKNDHLIINQVYGGGANDSTPVSHSFIELYNPTDNAISLEGYSIGYLSNGKSNTPQEVKLALSGSVPSHTSYLIRCEQQDTSTPDLIKFTVSKFDQEWTQTIDNKRYQITLYKGNKVEDAVSVNEGNVEGSTLSDGTISKQKAIRRIGFADTNNNTADFEVVSYKDDATAATEKYPRSLADGAWGSGETPKPDPDPTPAKLAGSVSIRGNAIVGATLYADDAGITNNTGTLSYQWMADEREIPGANSAFLSVEKGLTGKQIFVKVTSSVETGTLTSEKTAAVVEKEAQTTHLIINQVYGGGGKGKTPVSASFIELYNPTAEDIGLSGYTIEYLSGSTQKQLELTGTVTSHTSYLIKGQEEKTSADLICTIEKADQEWDLAISNKQYRILLKKGEEQIDGVSVNEEAAEGTALADPENDTIISKKKAIRRISFIDTGDNAADFEVLNYSKIPSEILDQVKPRSTADGSWGMKDIVKPEKYYTVTFDADGEKESVSVKEGEKASEKEAPQKEGYTFLGWYLEDQKYDFETPVSTDITLCAKWEKNETPTPDPLPDIDPKPEPKPNPTPDPKPTPSETIQAPQIVSVKSIAKKKMTAVQITVEAVQGATGYQIYRKKGSKVTMIGQTSGTVFLDQNPVSGTSSYYAKAIKGSLTGKEGSAKKITLPKATTKVTAKAKTDKTVVLSWKKVKGATGYLLYRSTKKNGSYQRIAVLKKGTKCTYTDKKGLKKGMKYYYRIVTVKKKTYSPAKTTKAVKIKAAKKK